MSIHPIMQKLAAKFERTDLPEFAPGDTVRVQVKIREGEKERLQAFEGMVIACRKGAQGTFTVRKMSFGQGVERIFPYNSKVVDKVEKVRSYEVRRSKLFYLRGLRGKAARLREVERAKLSFSSLVSTEPRLRSWLCFARSGLYTRLERAWLPFPPPSRIRRQSPQLLRSSGC